MEYNHEGTGDTEKKIDKKLNNCVSKPGMLLYLKLQIEKCKVQIEKCKVQIENWKLQSAN